MQMLAMEMQWVEHARRVQISKVKHADVEHGHADRTRMDRLMLNMVMLIEDGLVMLMLNMDMLIEVALEKLWSAGVEMFLNDGMHAVQ